MLSVPFIHKFLLSLFCWNICKQKLLPLKLSGTQGSTGGIEFLSYLLLDSHGCCLGPVPSASADCTSSKEHTPLHRLRQYRLHRFQVRYQVLLQILILTVLRRWCDAGSWLERLGSWLERLYSAQNEHLNPWYMVKEIGQSRRPVALNFTFPTTSRYWQPSVPNQVLP